MKDLHPQNGVTPDDARLPLRSKKMAEEVARLTEKITGDVCFVDEGTGAKNYWLVVRMDVEGREKWA